MITPAAKRLLHALGWYAPASRLWMRAEPRLTNAVRAVTGKDGRLIQRYLATHQVRGLHIGCGGNHLAGWLNTELCPRGDEIFLDATRRFPLPDASFDFVYSEHMIEHIPFTAAVGMMGECYRILRPGGILRIVTPDMVFLRTLLEEPVVPAVAAYLAYAHAEHNVDGPRGSGLHVFNHFVRAWGHQFIYDEPSLTALLCGAGFTGVATRRLTESPHERLRGLAKTDRMPAGFLEMESVTVEGQKPSR